MGLRGAVVLAIVSLATACLITNCPKGGKRSKPASGSLASTNQVTDCVRCGPGLLGRCVGPAVCCGPNLGCLVATPGVLQQCGGAVTLPQAHGKPCISSAGIGICAADGVCCNSESCHMDISCEVDPSAAICTPEETVEDNRF